MKNKRYDKSYWKKIKEYNKNSMMMRFWRLVNKINRKKAKIKQQDD